MTTIAKRSLAGGEISPSLYAREDTTKHQTGVRKLRNAYVMRHGGAQNRPGTTFVCETKDSSKATRLVKFVFNSSQTYVLEFGHQYMRIIENGEQVREAAKTITAISAGASTVLTSNGHGYGSDEIYISGIVGPIGQYLNNRNFKLVSADNTANTFKLYYMDGTAVNSTLFGSYTSGGTAERVYTIATPYASTDLAALQYVQSADVITIVHPSYPVRELSRTALLSWSLNLVTFAPIQAAPTAVASSGAGSSVFWKVTAVGPDGEESLASSSTASLNTIPTAGSPEAITWVAASNAVAYRVYRNIYGYYGFVGQVTGTTFTDVGLDNEADYTVIFPTARNPFSSTNNYPSAVSYFQQRRVFANTNNDPETVFCSRTGIYANFTVSQPIQDDDAITFTMAGRQVNAVRHLLEVNRPIVMTDAAEWSLGGDNAGILRPGDINPKLESSNGASSLSPIVSNNSVLYVQSRGSIIRDLAFEYQSDGYRGNDLTIFASHLVDGHTLVDWDYQQTPHSIVWAVRDDGILLGLTYVKEQEIVAWHRHDTDGVVENVCVVPEGDEDAVYIVVKRTVDSGVEKRYIERFASRKIVESDDPREGITDYIGMDSTLTYDGRNTNSSHTMKIYNGTTYDADDMALKIQSSVTYFSTSDIGNMMIIYVGDDDGNVTDQIRCTITGFQDSANVTVTVNKDVPVGLQNVVTAAWAKAVDEIQGLWHLNYKDVSVLGDGFVVFSPKNSPVTATHEPDTNDGYKESLILNGTLTLPRPYAVIHAGLPFVTDIETLDLDNNQGLSSETLVDKNKNVTGVTVRIEKSRGMWVGFREPEDETYAPLEGLVEPKARNDESYDVPISLATEKFDVPIEGNWNDHGRVFIRQVDPLPLTVLGIYPAGRFPFK